MTRMFNPTVGSSATSANRRHSRLPFQADLATARGIITTWRATASKRPSASSRPRLASPSHGKVQGERPSIPIAAQGSGRVGPLRGFLPRGLSNACPHASSCSHGAADKGRHRTTLNRRQSSKSSRRFTCWLTAPCVMCRRFAATVMLPLSATVTKVRIRSRSRFRVIDALCSVMNSINNIGFDDASAIRTVQVSITRMRANDFLHSSAFSVRRRCDRDTRRRNYARHRVGCPLWLCALNSADARYRGQVSRC